MPFLKIEDIEPRTVIPGYHAHFVHTEAMTFAYWTIEAGAPLPEHNHPHEQVATMLDGEYELVVGGEARRLRPGDVAVIPSNVLHSGHAVTDCRILDVFHPIREDYR